MALDLNERDLIERYRQLVMHGYGSLKIEVAKDVKLNVIKISSSIQLTDQKTLPLPR